MEEGDHKEEESQDTQKVYKIKFEINLLASIGEYKKEDPENRGNYIFVNEGISLMALAAESEEMPIFDSENFNVLI